MRACVRACVRVCVCVCVLSSFDSDPTGLYIYLRKRKQNTSKRLSSNNVYNLTVTVSLCKLNSDGIKCIKYPLISSVNTHIYLDMKRKIGNKD